MLDDYSECKECEEVISKNEYHNCIKEISFERNLEILERPKFQLTDVASFGTSSVLRNILSNSLDSVFADKVVKKLENEVKHVQEQKSYLSEQYKASMDKNEKWELIIGEIREKYIQKAASEDLDQDELLNEIVLDLDSFFKE